MHVLDRGTQGEPTLRWALRQGIPYLTLQKGDVNWRRYRNPTCMLDTGVPVFVRVESRLNNEVLPSSGQARLPVTIVFPARPSQGLGNARAIRYRTAADVGNEALKTLDEVYKTRWPNNENAIKALIAVGFDANLDRTLSPTTSRGQDGAQARAVCALETLDEALHALDENADKTAKEQTQATNLRKKLAKKRTALAKLQAVPARLGTRADTGAEHGCKVLMLMLFNALALVLWRSPLEAIRTMSPLLVGQLLLWRPATACLENGKVTLWLEPMVEQTDGRNQQELVRLFNEEKLEIRGARLALKIHESKRKCRAAGS